MDTCARNPNAMIGSTNITWSQAATGMLGNFSATSYVRPDTGGALLPWIYTLIVIILHLPVVVIRVVRWEIVQSWCLVTTFFTVVVYAQAFIATKFEASEILVWTPVVLVIDAGSMLQVFFLVIEAKKVKVNSHTMIIDVPENEPNAEASLESSGLLTRFRPIWVPRNARPRDTPLVQQVNGNNAEEDECLSCPTHCQAPQDERLPLWKDPAAYSAVIAALLFFATLVLQMLGLVKAAQALRASPKPPDVKWCSPLFQPFGIAAVDGDCHVYAINRKQNKGIGCIAIAGYWQRHWLKGTVAGIAVEIAAQVIDLFTLWLANKDDRCCGGAVKTKRPWTTIFLGGVVLIVTLIYGFTYASGLPPGVTGRMTVIEPSTQSYTVNLTSAGLRGTIIGWSDGLFENWKSTYFGYASI